MSLKTPNVPKLAAITLVALLHLPLVASKLSITQTDETNKFQLSQTDETNEPYTLQKSTDLSQWTDLEVPSTETNTFVFEYSGNQAEYYRLATRIDYGTPEEWIGGPIASHQVSPNSLSNEASGYYTIVAAKAFAYFTGTLEQAYFEPVGEVANYFGYAALRGEIRDLGGPQADEGFRGTSWMETLEILDAPQRQLIYNLVDTHKPLFSGFFDIRLDLVDELWARRQGSEIDIPHAIEIGLQMGRDEAELTVTSAETYHQITQSLTEEQLQSFQDIRSGVTSIADMQQDGPQTATIEAEIAQFNDIESDVLLAISSKLIAWATGTADNAVFLPPGKISNYFGFASYRYVDRANVSRSDAANKFLSVLNETQVSIIAGLAENIVAPSNDYIDGREDLIRASYSLKSGQSINPPILVEYYANHAALGETQRAIVEALTFYELSKTITPEQLTELASYRKDTTN